MNEVMHEDASDVAAALSPRGRPPGRSPGRSPASDPEAAAALTRLYDRHAALVFSLCRRGVGPLGGSAADAEDAVQETFIRAFARLDQLSDPAGFRAWLCAIATNVCAEHRRSAGRRARHEAEAMSRIVHENPLGAGSGGATAAEAAAHHEDLERLTRAMAQLPDDQRLALHLYYLEADPVTAAMPALGVSRSGYYTLLDRARKTLAALMRTSVRSSVQESGTC